MSDDRALPDLLARDLRVVFCGTAAGTASALKRQYYAGPGNRFWSILHDTGLTPERLSPSDCHRLLDYGIGLTDLVKDQSGADGDLAFGNDAVAALEARIREFRPAVFCFNGKRAAIEFLRMKAIAYGRSDRTIASTALFVAPSTSGAAVKWWDPAIWHDLARLVREVDAEKIRSG